MLSSKVIRIIRRVNIHSPQLSQLGHGYFSSECTKVLRMVNTLAADNEAKQTIEALQKELQKTKEKFQAVEELKQQSADAGTLVDSYISGKIVQLKEQFATLEKREERYKTVFADRISVFRRACCELFGYKRLMDDHRRPDGIPVTRFTLQSIYAQSDDEKLEFEYETGNSNILVNDYVKQREISQKDKQSFERIEVSRSQALEIFSDNQFKVERNNDLPEEKTMTVYRCGPLVDLCRGPHIPDTSFVKAFRCLKASSAYWRGNKDRESLQRVYGILFQDQNSLEQYLKDLEEARKYDHRELGKKQELFFFHELSPGSCFFLKHGMRVYNKLVEFIRREYESRGYEERPVRFVGDKETWVRAEAALAEALDEFGKPCQVLNILPLRGGAPPKFAQRTTLATGSYQVV